jgi:hypothetical protein
MLGAHRWSECRGGADRGTALLKRLTLARDMCRRPCSTRFGATVILVLEHHNAAQCTNTG